MSEPSGPSVVMRIGCIRTVAAQAIGAAQASSARMRHDATDGTLGDAADWHHGETSAPREARAT